MNGNFEKASHQNDLQDLFFPIKLAAMGFHNNSLHSSGFRISTIGCRDLLQHTKSEADNGLKKLLSAVALKH